MADIFAVRPAAQPSARANAFVSFSFFGSEIASSSFALQQTISPRCHSERALWHKQLTTDRHRAPCWSHWFFRRKSGHRGSRQLPLILRLSRIGSRQKSHAAAGIPAGRGSDQSARGWLRIIPVASASVPRVHFLRLRQDKLPQDCLT